MIFLDFNKALDRLYTSRKPHSSAWKYWSTLFYSSVNFGHHHYRKQSVDVDSDHSEPLEVGSGAPKGSFLCPLFFWYCINDIVSFVQQVACIRVFADDCVLFRNSHIQSYLIFFNNSLTSITEWCALWRIQFNNYKSVTLGWLIKTPFTFPAHWLFFPARS